MSSTISTSPGALAAPARRAERRIRLKRAFEVGATALSLALVLAAVVLVLRKTGHVSEAATRLVLAGCAAATLLACVIAYLRPLAERAGAVALDRYHSLSDRLSSALSFLALAPSERTPFMEVAIDDAVRVVGTLDPRRAVPFRIPRDASAAFVLALATLSIGLFEVRRHEVVVVARTIDAVDVTADDLDAMRDFLKEIEQKAGSEEAKAATEEFNQLIADLAAKRLDRTEAFRKMQALEDRLLEGSVADHKALEAALAKIGDEMKKAELTRPAGNALSSDHLADAEQALKDLADKLRKEAKEGKGPSKVELEKMRDALKRASEDNAKQQAAIAERREQLQQELLKEKKKQAEKDGGASDQDKSLLEKKERELERLEKEQAEAESGGRQLDRLDRELSQAAADLMKDLGATADDLDKGAEDINRMAQQEMSQEEKEQLKQKIDELREMIRQQGQGGKQQMVRLRRFQAGARGQGQQGQGGQGQSGEFQEGEGEQGQNGHGQGQQGQGQGQQGQGQRGEGQQGQGQGQQGQGGQGGQGQGAGGETWVVGPNGEKILMLSRGGSGAGLGQGQGRGAGAGEGQNGGGGDGKGGHGWGTGHDDHVQGGAHSIRSGTEDTQVAGQDTGQGSSRSEVIQGAAERGFTSRGYQKVYREYHTVAEEALAKDEIPGGYRSYVRRYFELIRPREQKP